MKSLRLLWMLTSTVALVTASKRRPGVLDPAPEFDQHLEVKIQTQNDSKLLNFNRQEEMYPHSLEMSITKTESNEPIFILDLVLNKDLIPDNYYEKHHHEVRIETSCHLKTLQRFSFLRFLIVLNCTVDLVVYTVLSSLPIFDGERRRLRRMRLFPCSKPHP